MERIEGQCDLPMHVGDYFYVEDYRLYVPDGQYICIWALQSMMPVFPLLVEKDNLDDTHWVKSVKNFSCPDPKGRVQYMLGVIE